MRFNPILAAVAASLVAVAAHAAPVLKQGSMLISADGRKIGQIDRIIPAPDGTPSVANVIFDERMVHIPASTISVTDTAVVTSLSRAEIRKLN